MAVYHYHHHFTTVGIVVIIVIDIVVVVITRLKCETSHIGKMSMGQSPVCVSFCVKPL